jgi:hypothetical protein
MADSLRPVRVGACRCPGAPHEDGDVVFVAEELTTPAGLAATAALLEGDGGWNDRYAGMVMALVRHQVVDWTLRDDDGPIRVAPSAVEKHLPWLRGGKEVAAALSSMFQGEILDPFTAASRQPTSAKKTPTTSSSPDGSTDTESTSPTPISPRKPRKG